LGFNGKNTLRHAFKKYAAVKKSILTSKLNIALVGKGIIEVERYRIDKTEKRTKISK